MSDEPRDTEIRRYLPHAFLATVWVICVPMLLVSSYIRLIDPPPSRLLSATLGVLLSIAAVIAGTAVWMRRPGSGVVSFGDLMLWGWIRRYRAEKSLRDGSRVLGFDRTGRPVGQVNLTVEEQLKVLHQLNDALETKDPYTHGHSRRVEKHCYRMGMQLNLGDKNLEDLRLAAALHDVGKVAVPDEILRKPGPLDPPELEVMNQHPVVGERMVQDIRNTTIINAIRHHHEAFGGGGYPDGIAGQEIPIFSRIIAVADTYDAMTSTRPYRTGMPRKKAVAIISEEKGRQFDPVVVDAFLADHSVPMPIPVGVAQLIDAPRELLMRLLVWGKQVGTASLASATAAAGIAVAGVAGVLAPSAPAPARSHAPAVAAPSAEVVTADEPGDSVLGLRVNKKAKKATKEDPPRHRGSDNSEVRAAVVASGGRNNAGNGSAGNAPDPKGKKPSGNGGRPGNDNPPVDPPPVEPPRAEPPVEPPPAEPPVERPPVDPPPVQEPPRTSPPPAGGSGGGGGQEGTPTPPPPPSAPPDGNGTMPPPGPPQTTPPHTPGTDPQPDRGRDTEQRGIQRP